MLQPILKINLTESVIDSFIVPEDWLNDFLGAGSLAARILYEVLTPDLRSLSPEAPLLFLNGPLTGTAGPAVGRFVICAKSPATGLWGESNVGGFWGPELRKAGFDGVWIEGRAKSPVYLDIHDGEVNLRDASNLWGLDPYQTQEIIKNDHEGKNIRVASIGVAGEAQIPYALILCDHGRVAGRTGMGAVMGSKNLKAVAVKGTGTVPMIDWEAYKPLRSQANRDLRDHNQTKVLRELGSSGGSDYFDFLGEMPKKYFQNGVFEGAYKISGSSFAETILTGVSACHACVIACGRVVQLESDPEKEKRKGPEYETIIGFGPNLLIDDPQEITILGEYCDRYGLDSISMSNIIGLAFKLFEEGLITEVDTGGVGLNWGDHHAAAWCIHATARREGIGDIMAQGASGLAGHYGAPEEAVQVNGLELAYHDPRGSSGMALVYATSPRGGCHNQSDYYMVDIGHCEEELGIHFYARHAGAAKAANVARHQDWRTVNNALVLCIFANVPAESVVDLVNAGMNMDLDLEDLLRSGERGWNLKRAINNRLGLTRENDKLPKPLLRPFSDGGSAGFVPDLPNMLTAYYHARGWDPETGYPTPAKLAELGLGWVVDDLWSE